MIIDISLVMTGPGAPRARAGLAWAGFAGCAGRATHSKPAPAAAAAAVAPPAPYLLCLSQKRRPPMTAQSVNSIP